MPAASAAADPPDDPAHVLDGIKRVSGGTINPVGGVCAGAKLRGVGFREYVCTGRPDIGDHVVVFGRYMVLVDQRTPRSSQVPGRVQILDADRQAMQQAQILAVGYRFFCGFRVGFRCSFIHGDNGVERAIGLGDAFKTGVEKLNRRKGFDADQAARFNGAEITGFGHFGSCPHVRLLAVAHHPPRCPNTIRSSRPEPTGTPTSAHVHQAHAANTMCRNAAARSQAGPDHR